jgi:hypothetical protein
MRRSPGLATSESPSTDALGGDVDAPSLGIPSLGASARYGSTRLRRNADLVAMFAEVVTEDEFDGAAYPHPISGPFTMRQGLRFIRFHLRLRLYSRWSPDRQRGARTPGWLQAILPNERIVL